MRCAGHAHPKNAEERRMTRQYSRKGTDLGGLYNGNNGSVIQKCAEVKKNIPLTDLPEVGDAQLKNTEERWAIRQWLKRP